MQLLNSYEDRDEAENALSKLTGEKRLASERDGTVIIYNLFGQPTWKNFYVLDMFELSELERIISARKNNKSYDKVLHSKILSTLSCVSRMYGLEIPRHWF